MEGVGEFAGDNKRCREFKFYVLASGYPRCADSLVRQIGSEGLVADGEVADAVVAIVMDTDTRVDGLSKLWVGGI